MNIAAQAPPLSQAPSHPGLGQRLRRALSAQRDKPSLIDRWAEKTRQALQEEPIQHDHEFLRWLLPKMHLWARWFDADVRGMHNIPDGPALLVGNHSGGVLTPDTAVFISAWYRRFGLDRPLLGLAFDATFSIPGFGTIMRKIGMMPASHRNADLAFARGASILVYPGGSHEAFRPWSDRNKIDFNDHMGFIRLALRQGVPIVPVVGHGGHESLVVLSRGTRMAQALRLHRVRVDINPVLLHFPWGVTPASFVGVPLPAKITVQIGEPIQWQHFDSDDAKDPERVRACYDEVTGTMQGMLDDLAAEVPYPLLTRARRLVPDVRTVTRGVRQKARLAMDVPKMVATAHTSPDRLLRDQASRRPHDPALLFEDRRYTFAEASDRVQQLAHWFTGRGVCAGDTAALVLESTPDLVFAMMGLNRIGAAGALVHPSLHGEPLRHAIAATTPRLVLVGPETASAVVATEPDVPVYGLGPDEALPPDVIAASAAVAGARTPLAPHAPRNDDTFAYIYTSGTTGLPKAAVMRNQRVIGGGAVFGRLMHEAGPGDVVYVPLPLFHTNPLCSGWGTVLVTGATMAMRRRFSVSGFWDDVKRFDATSFVYIGEVCRYLLSAPGHPHESDHGLRAAVGNGLSPEIWERFTARFEIPAVREFYGSTEGNAFAMNLRGRPGMIGRLSPATAVARWDADREELARDADGRAQPVRPGETGLLVGRLNPLVVYDGYVDEKATDAKILRDVFREGDAWFDTGDLITLHRGRWASFADRVGDTFRWKGENVSTSQVAAVIRGMSDIDDAVVYGVRVPGCDGRAGMAALATPELDPDQWLHEVQAGLAPHQRPCFVRVLPDGPAMTETFKHQKKAYIAEGFDPASTDDPLFAVIGGELVPIDDDVHSRIVAGDLQVGG